MVFDIVDPVWFDYVPFIGIKLAVIARIKDTTTKGVVVVVIDLDIET